MEAETAARARPLLDALVPSAMRKSARTAQVAAPEQNPDTTGRRREQPATRGRVAQQSAQLPRELSGKFHGPGPIRHRRRRQRVAHRWRVCGLAKWPAGRLTAPLAAGAVAPVVVPPAAAKHARSLPANGCAVMPASSVRSSRSLAGELAAAGELAGKSEGP